MSLQVKHGNNTSLKEMGNPLQPTQLGRRRRVLGEIQNDNINNIHNICNEQPKMKRKLAEVLDVEPQKRARQARSSHHSQRSKRLKKTLQVTADDELSLSHTPTTHFYIPPPPQDLLYLHNPNTFSQYASHITQHLKSAETNFVKMDELVLNTQKHVTTTMRAVVIDWIIDVHSKFKLQDEVLLLAISITDQYLTRSPLSSSRKLQLLALTSLLIASKYEEIYPPEVADFVWITQKHFSREEILATEVDILNVLEFDLSAPTVLQYINRLCRVIGLPEKYRVFALYLLELSLPSSDPILWRYPGSQVAAAIVHLCCRTFKGELYEMNVRVPYLVESVGDSYVKGFKRRYGDWMACLDAPVRRQEAYVPYNGNTNGVNHSRIQNQKRGMEKEMGMEWEGKKDSESKERREREERYDPICDECRVENWGPFLEHYSGWKRADLLELENQIGTDLRLMSNISVESVLDDNNSKKSVVHSTNLKHLHAVKRKYASESLYEWSLVNFG